MNKKSYYLILGYNFLDYFIEEMKENYPMFDSIDKDQAIEKMTQKNLGHAAHCRRLKRSAEDGLIKLYLLEITEVIPNA